MFKKIKSIIFLFLLSYSSSLSAQTNLLKISGSVQNSPYSYAYLFMSDRNLTLKEPITNGTFNFRVNKDKDFEMAILYFGLDSSRTYADVLEKRNSGVFESKIIVLDDSVKVHVKENVNESQVTGGDKSKALNAMNEAIQTGNYNLFFTAHSTSPLALMLLGILIRLDKNLINKTIINYEQIYNNLPLNLQNSKVGKEVKSLIDIEKQKE